MAENLLSLRYTTLIYSLMALLRSLVSTWLQWCPRVPLCLGLTLHQQYTTGNFLCNPLNRLINYTCKVIIHIDQYGCVICHWRMACQKFVKVVIWRNNSKPIRLLVDNQCGCVLPFCLNHGIERWSVRIKKKPFWSLTKTINFLRWLWLIDIKSVLLYQL